MVESIKKKYSINFQIIGHWKCFFQTGLLSLFIWEEINVAASLITFLEKALQGIFLVLHLDIKAQPKYLRLAVFFHFYPVCFSN